jgi:hypothetical protein
MTDYSDLADLAANANGDEPDTLDSWRPVDLTAAIYGDKVRPEPTILRRSDGRGLFYAGQINYLHGADGVGKSLVGLFGSIEELEAGRHVVWLDWEDPDETTIVARLLDLGVDADVILERFHYHHPETEATPAAIAEVCDLVRRLDARLVVVDSVGEALGIDGINEDKDNEVTPWFRWVLRPLAGTGAAVLPIDHGIKSGENPFWPSGSKRKRAMVTGASYLVEAPRPISKEFNGGQLKLTCGKDRHGNYTRGKPAAIIDVVIFVDTGSWTVDVHPPEPATNTGSQNDKVLARAITEAVREMQQETGQPVSMNRIEKTGRIKGSATARRAAAEYARDLGSLTEDKGPRTHACSAS